MVGKEVAQIELAVVCRWRWSWYVSAQQKVFRCHLGYASKLIAQSVHLSRTLHCHVFHVVVRQHLSCCPHEFLALCGFFYRQRTSQWWSLCSFVIRSCLIAYIPSALRYMMVNVGFVYYRKLFQLLILPWHWPLFLHLGIFILAKTLGLRDIIFAKSSSRICSLHKYIGWQG